VRPAAKAAESTSAVAAAMEIRRAMLTSFRWAQPGKDHWFRGDAKRGTTVEHGNPVKSSA